MNNTYMLPIHTMTLEQRYEESKITGKLVIPYMKLTVLPTLPETITHLYCHNNLLTILPALPSTLTTVLCFANQLIDMPALPSSLTYLDCSNNQLTSLPILSEKSTHLYCSNNQLKTLPELPILLTHLSCYDNRLTTLPALPKLLYLDYCRNPFTTTFIQLTTRKNPIQNIREYYANRKKQKIQARNTLAIQKAFFHTCVLNDDCLGRIGSYLSGQCGTLSKQLNKLQAILTL